MNKAESILIEAVSAFLRQGHIKLKNPISAGDWRKVFLISQEQKVLPMVYEAVYENIGEDERAFFAPYKKKTIQDIFIQENQTADFLRIYGYLEEKGFHPLVVKGILCRDCYISGSHRISHDEDLLVPEEEFKDCCAALEACGMEPLGNVDFSEYEIGWKKDGLVIELHRTLFPKGSAAYSELNDYFKDAYQNPVTYATESGRKVKSLSPHDHMLFMLFHMYKHFVHSGFGLRQVCDAGMWVKKYADAIDWELLRRQCEETHILRFSAAVLMLFEKYMKIPLPLPEFWRSMDVEPEPMLHDVLSGGIYGTNDAGRAHSSTVTLNAVEADRSDKKRSVLKSVFPPREKMVSKYPELREHPALLPVAWAKRIVKYAKETRTEHGSGASESLQIAKDRIELLKLYGIIE